MVLLTLHGGSNEQEFFLRQYEQSTEPFFKSYLFVSWTFQEVINGFALHLVEGFVSSTSLEFHFY